jgi:hypothetical protein
MKRFIEHENSSRSGKAIMRNKIIFFSAIVCLSGLLTAAFGQTPTAAPKNSVITGDVVSISAGKIVLQTKDGEVNVTLSEKTEYKRVSPDNPSLKAAVAAAFTEIGNGDKLMVTGLMSDDQKTLPAKSVYLMTKSDIAQKQAKDKERWSARGIAGRIVTVNPNTKQITIEVPSLGAAATSVVLTPKPEAKYMRYARNSADYSDANTSAFSDLKAGDMLRAVGDKSADGASFAAEEILTGAFQTLAGSVKAVDTAKNEVVITDLQTKKDVTVDLGSASLLKRFPEHMAQMMVARQGAAAGEPGQSGQVQGRPGGGFGPHGSIDEMLERFPSITAADLKSGEIIAVSSTKPANPNRITAIRLLAGVEPFIRAAQATSSGRRGQRAQSLNIPGLDGFDIP